MLDWKKNQKMQALLGFSVIVLGQLISFCCGKLLDSGLPDAIVIVGLMLSVLCSVWGLVIWIRGLFPTTRILRIIFVFLALSFVIGVIIGIYYLLN